MTRKLIPILAVTIACQCGLIVHAQEQSARARLMAAHGQYYTPTASGLRSFQCDAKIDWKAMLTRATGKEVPDDNPALKYLQDVHLSIADQLKGTGSLEWTSSADPPEKSAEGVKQIKNGLQTMIGGFFTSWNSYMNGSMTPLPDQNVTVTDAGAGVHMSATTSAMKVDEEYDKNMILTQTLVESPGIKILATPTYTASPDGLIVSSIRSQINQPPTAPQTEITVRVDYAKVDSFQIPSHVVFDLKNTGQFDLSLSGCKTSVAGWAKK